MADGVISLAGLVRAVVWLRWRLMVNHFRSARRRDALERANRWADAAVRGVLLLTAIQVVPLLTAGAVILGWSYARGEAGELAPVLVRVWLLLYVLAVLVSPIAFGGGPVLPATARFLLLPVTRRRLHAVRFLSGLADPWLLSGGVPLLLLSVGFLLGGDPWRAARTFLAGALLVLMLAALASWLAMVILQLLRHRRRRDTAALAALVALTVGSFSIALGGDAKAVAKALEAAVVHVNVPGELYLRAVFGAFGAPAVLALCGLAATAAGLYALSARAHRRLLADPGSVSGPRTRRRAGRELRVPGLSRAASAVASTQVRVLWRTVPGKMAVLQGLIAAMLAGVITLRVPVTEWPAFVVAPELLLCFGVLLFVYLGQIQLLCNQLAIDRAGLTLAFLLPLPTRDLLYGKAAGLGFLAFAAFALAAGPIGWIAGSSWWEAAWSLLLAGLALAGVYLAMAPLVALLSALLPKAVDLGRAFTKTRPHPLALVAGMTASSVACGVPAALIALGTGLLGSRLATLALLLGWLAAAGLAARLAMPAAARVAWRRREAVLLVAREG